MIVSLGTTTNGRGATTQAVVETFSFIPTNWGQTVDLPLFDSALGTLTAISLQLSGDVGGSMAYESQDTSPQTITMTLGAAITVAAPAGLVGLSELATINPEVQIPESTAGFDGTLDFDGTSGSTFSSLFDNAVSITTYDDTNPLWEFSIKDYFTSDTLGTTVELGIAAIGQGSGTGSGNLALNFLTNAGGELTVSYTYDSIPEPSSFAMIGSALLLLARRRRT